LIQVADGVFCETTWDGANVGAILTDDGVVLVDSPMLPRDARAWKEQISRISEKRVVFLVNTDYHFDHMMTDCLLCDRIIAHSLAEPAFLAQDGEIFEQMLDLFFPDVDAKAKRGVRKLRSVAPFITFSENLVLNMGSRRIEITRVGGHTPATAVVHLPESGILFTGDLHEHELHPYAGDGNIIEWIEALNRIEGMDVTKIVPGHGDVCDLKSVVRMRQYFEEMKERVLELMRKGCNRDEVEERVDLFSYFPVEEGKEARAKSFIRLGVGRMFSQLEESGGCIVAP
jgi:cyclase